MTRRLAVLFALAAGAASAADPTPQHLAARVVGEVLRVTDKDVVQVTGSARDAAFLEELAVQAAKRGADVHILLAPGAAAQKRLHAEVPEKFDGRPRTAELALADKVTVFIGLDPAESDGDLADVPAKRVAARGAQAAAVAEKLQARGVRIAYLSNGLYPTDDRARQFGVTKAELTKLYHAGLGADPATLRANAEAVRTALAAGKTARLTTPAGTDLTVGLGGRALASDGVITDDKVKAGGAARTVWLPAGEVYVVPKPWTATGTVAVPAALWEGRVVKNLKLTFAAGKLTAMTGEGDGFARLKASHAAAGDGRDALTALDVGVNPAVQLPAASPGGAYMAAGTVTVALGNNTWAGGTVTGAFSLPVFVRGGTLEIDGTPLVKDGSLVVK